jgi:hypothetical protein
MAKGKTYTLKGAAAGAFVNAQCGTPAKDDNERALRVATLIHLNMQTSPESAVALVKAVAKYGLEFAAKICTADRKSE